MTTKYSAGFLQRHKMFSSKKENKDITNLKPNVPVSNVYPAYNNGYDSKMLLFNKPSSSKSKKFP